MNIRKSKKILIFLIIAITTLGGCGKSKDLKSEDNPIKEGEKIIVSFINIGKGDAFLIDIPEHGYYLCDTGKAEDFSQIERFLRVKGVESLKGIFLSHGHKDHAGGLEAITKAFKTEKIYLSALDRVSYEKIDVKEISKKNGIEVVELKGGEKLSLGIANVEVWIPEKVDKKNANNNSVVLRISYGNTAYLMTGDMEKGEEAKLLASGINVKADVLKLGHHGENDATTVNLLQKVKAKYGIICGNAEENPDSMNTEIAERLKSYGVQPYYSEGEQLAIDFISDGNFIKTENVIDKDSVGN